MQVFKVLVLVMTLLLQVSSNNHDTPKTLYILLDGFRWDYVDLQPNLAGFQKFLKEGVRAKWTNPIYPSLSFPTWTTLSTGLFPESHGIVGNYFFDHENNDGFALFDQQGTGQKKWWSAEPIWTTATKKGIRTASIYWSRCDIEYDGILPEYCHPWVKASGADIFHQHLNTALEKFEEGFEFVLVYTEHVDNKGHDFGPEAEETQLAVRELDQHLKTFLDQLETKNLTDKVNIIIVSDHGMTDTGRESVERIEIDDYLDTNLVENIADKGAFMNIKVKPENVEQVYEQLKKIQGVDIFKHDDIPEYLHYKNHKFIHEIILKAKPGYWVLASKDAKKMLPERSSYFFEGAHGYEGTLEDMRGIFFAKGPVLKICPVAHRMKMIYVYLMSLHISGRPFHGRLAQAPDVLRVWDYGIMTPTGHVNHKNHSNHQPCQQDYVLEGSSGTRPMSHTIILVICNINSILILLIL
ncbi:unnamed protein product, partial [Meganyctiphanes norvegica]